MRFRHHERPSRHAIRVRSAQDPVEAEVHRSTLPQQETFPSGIVVGDSVDPPAQVSGVSASAGLRTLVAEWDRLEDFYSVDGAGGYEVQLDTVNTFDSGSERTQRTSATLASFGDLNANTTYYVRVRAVQGADNAGEWSATASTTTAQAGTSDIQAGAVTTDRLVADAVTAAKLASITMEVGKHLQSDNYDGTDVATGDATQGFRIEASGAAEFLAVRVRASELYADRRDPETADVFQLGTADAALSDGNIDPSPGNRTEFHAIADNGVSAFAQSYWYLDADNGLDPTGFGNSLKLRNDLYLGDYLGPPTLDSKTVVELRGGASPQVRFNGERAWPAVGAFADRSAQSVLPNAGTTMVLSTSEDDPDNMHDGSGVFTIPFAGLWIVYGYLQTSANTSSARFLVGYSVNGGTDRWRNDGGGNTNNTMYVSFCQPVPLAAGDAVRLRCYQTTGGSINIDGHMRLHCVAPG